MLAPQFLYALSETTSPAASYSITSHTSIVVFSSTTTCRAKEMSRERERDEQREREREREREKERESRGRKGERSVVP